MTATNALPRYRCHKIVRAAKIRAIEEVGSEDGAVNLRFEGTDVTVRVSVGWINRHQPLLGGYYVVYDDLYASYSPALAFEAGYRLGASALTDDVRAALLLAQGALENVNEPIDGSALDAVNTVLEADRQLRTEA